MAGHSHWARIKRAKAVTDARRGKLWSKLSRGIIVAARSGGSDPAMNLALRYAIDAARDANMPKDTIERAIKKGAGELGADDYAAVNYEGYGPGGAGVICAALTDNRTRTAPEIKKLFELNGGNVGQPGSVSWMFTKRGVIAIAREDADEEKVTSIALEGGADDVQAGDEGYEVTCAPEAFSALRQLFTDAGVKMASAEISLIANTTVTLAGEQAEQMLKLIEALEEHDDVQNVYSNFELSAEDAARLSGG
jgi:YebC/PmpR family DNA-binding regulatory protein